MADTDVAAIQLLKRAVELDTSKRYTEALPCYQEGLDLLLQFIKTIGDKEKKGKYRQKARSILTGVKRFMK